jgi:PAS domain S-box-containing protein
MSELTATEHPTAGKPTPLLRLRRWWSRQSPQRQDRFAMLAPLAAVLLFLLVIMVVFAYLRFEEIAREREAINRDIEYTQQRLRLRLLEQQEQLMRFAREVSSREVSRAVFLARAEAFASIYPELQGLTWIDDKKLVRVSFNTASRSDKYQKSSGSTISSPDTVENFQTVRDLLLPIYSTPHAVANMAAVLQLHLPLIDKAQFKGDLMAEYSIDALYRYGVPFEITSKYAVSFHDAQGRPLAGTSVTEGSLQRRLLPWANPINAYEIPVSPVGNGLTIRGQVYRTSLGLIGSGLFWLVMLLSGATAWLLLANWRHTRRRIQAQDALVQETAFRRAMENSMLTGMRALDMQGRITYVNSAFCGMTGWDETELIGRSAPFPYWPEEDFEVMKTRLSEELSGRVQASGIQLRVKRKDGSIIEARLYVSPLIDAFGQTNRLDDLDDRHHRTQPGARAVVGFARTLHHRAGSAGRIHLGGTAWAATSCCLPTSCTANGLAHKRAATCNWWHKPVCLPAQLTMNPPTVSTRLPDCPPTPFPTRKPRAPKSLSRN